LLGRTPSAQEFLERLRAELNIRNGVSADSPAYLIGPASSTGHKNQLAAA
jgi:hypothetical protein